MGQRCLPGGSKPNPEVGVRESHRPHSEQSQKQYLCLPYCSSSEKNALLSLCTIYLHHLERFLVTTGSEK